MLLLLRGALLASVLCTARVCAQQRGLFPAILNLASQAQISANATCGQSGPEEFCKLVEHVHQRRFQQKNLQCRICDHNSTAPGTERHPIGNVIDGTNDWWQSPSIQNGQQFHWVTVTLDLRQFFQIAYIIIKAGNSPRPGNWILERSEDGLTFEPWQYYAISDSECLHRYNITPRRGPPTYKSDHEVICTSYYSKLVPLEHGEIHTSLINGRPSAEHLTPELLQFTSARYIRLRFQRIRTLNADLMILNNYDTSEVDPIVTRRYYYSIKDVSVGGMCICYGHAQSCPLDSVTKKFKCVCEHNTCGESCNQCCPGYHQEAWQPGTLSVGNTCEKCNCHNKAVECAYNATVADQGLSLDTHGRRRGGGVCLDCSQNTAGINCEACRHGYYRPSEVSPYSDFPCVDCQCDLRGSESFVCTKDDEYARLGLPAGQCACRGGFAGRQCDRCAFGYRDFPQCVPCQCNLSGSTNADPCAPCVCKVNVMGSHCDLCKAGHFNLQPSNPEGCSDCFCFGVSEQLSCESSAMSMSQIVAGEALLRPSRGDSAHPAVESNDLVVPLGNNGSFPALAYQHVMSWAAPDNFLGNRLLSYGGHLTFSLLHDIPLDNEDNFVPAQCDIIIEGNGKTLRHSSSLLLLPSGRPVSVSMAMSPESFMHLDAHSGRDVHATRAVLMSVLSDLASLRVKVHLNAGPLVLRLSKVSLDIADRNSANRVQAVAVETCECPWGYAGTSCESCIPGFYRVGGVLYGGRCVQCECNEHASECDINGVCQGCDHNTTGSHCEACASGFYGDATEGTPADCQLCACPLTVATNNFSPTCVLEHSGTMSCDRCQEGYTGTHCERCADGFHGDPTVPGGTCARCECNGNADVGEAGHCDHATGECLRCRANTAGWHCEACRPGYYGDAVVAKDCRECGCDVNGALSSQCNVTTGQCDCRQNVVGHTCDSCQVGFFGLGGGHGCDSCNCSQPGALSESCDEQGRCQCVAGVAGDKCDRCAHGYYDDQTGDDGCKACDCAHTHGNCNPATGVCICPPHTEGAMCENCTSGFWGHHPKTGCQSCDCSAAGSSSPQCDLANGQCPCLPGFSGRSCERCAPGYHGYPRCTACGCDPAGTKAEFCNQTTGVCECETGQCVCKASVGGRGCEECVLGTFGLWAGHPSGCSNCYCSGRTERCDELSGMTRVPILAGDSALSVVSQLEQQGALTSGVFQQDGDNVLDTRRMSESRLTAPLYWKLPAPYEGNQMLSYGGLLSYDVVFYAADSAGLANQEPQVLMRGGTFRKLMIYTDMATPGNGVRTRHNISMTEHRWRYFNSVWEEPVSRSDFMMVLSSLQFVMIKASHGTGLLQSRISNVVMETAVEEEEGLAVRGGVARLIESCDCPPGYAGLSCQECSPGFYRGSVQSTQGSKSWVRPCLPCQCNNHSHTCDPETGECQACQHDTAGSHCELCAPGHYGTVTGSARDCSLCACPLEDKSFSSTCVLEAESGGFRCDACQLGYEGRYCERCAAGFHGDPSSPGGECAPCACGRGSLSDLCDPATGGCQCKVGFKGHLCDQCDDRSTLEGDQCVSCDDECTGVLLDDIEVIHEQVVSVNVSGLALAPYSQLVALERQRAAIQDGMSGVKNMSYGVLSSEERMTALASDLTDLLQRAANLSSEAEETGAAADQSVSQGALLLDKIGTLKERIQVLVVEAGLLNRTQEEELEWANHTDLLEEVTAMLDDISAVNLTQANDTVTDEHSLSVSTLRTVQSDFLASREATERSGEQLSLSLTRHTHALQDARALLQGAHAHNNHTHTLLDGAHAQLQQYQSLYQGLLLVNESLEMEELLTDAFSHTEYLLHINTTAQLEGYSEEVDQWRPLLRKHVDALVMGLKRTNALNSVYQTEEHARTLHALTHNFTSSLAVLCNTSRYSIPGIHGNRSVSSAVEGALETALQADAVATHTLNTTVQSEQPLAAEGRAAVNLSQSVLEQSRRINDSAHDLQMKVTKAATRLGLVKEGICNASQLLSQPIGKLGSLGNDSRSVIQEARQQVAVAQSDLQESLRRLDQLTKRLELSSSVVEQTSANISSANAMMSHSHTTANEAQRKLQEAELRTERLIDRMKPMRILGENLSRNLSDIRQLINQARRQAASIRVAVQSDRNCVRSYRSEVGTSNFNSVSLTVKTSTPDNLLFYMGSSTQVDYLAVQMHAGKVSMLWDAGSGESRVEYPHLLISNNKWTRINGTRFGGRGSLSVYQLEEPKSVPLSVATGASPGPARILDVDNNTLIHIGGLPAHTHSKVPSAVTQRSFEGCLGEVSVNGRNVGLWNYAHREGTCSGCFTSPQPEETAFHYDGTGYSVVVKSLRSTSTSIILQFKTLSPNGLLLYLASNGTRDFLSIELVDGRVRLTFDLGGGALTMTSRTAYNTGVWFKITLQRNKRKGYLSIMAADQSSEKEVLEAESPGSAADLNRSDLDPIYIGGLPASRPIRRQVVLRSFIGCIKNVEIANSYFDLQRDAYGVKKGCVLEAVRSVSVLKAGYVQLSAVPPFHQQGEILLTFATNNHSGTLLAAFSKADAQRGRRQSKLSYLAVQLVAGGVEAELAIGGVVSGVVLVKAPAGSSFSDGKPHSLIITLDRKILSVQLDEDLIESSPLSLSAGGAALSLSSVFIGGLPAGKADTLPARFRSAARSFRGCIQNLALEGMLVDLSGAVKYEGAMLDRCLLEERDSGAVLPDDPEADPTPDPVPPPPTQLSALTPGSLTCAAGVEPSFLPSAKQFGLSRNSHMTFTIDPNAIKKSFSLGVSLRTRAHSGLLLYLSNGNHMDYAMVQLAGGRLLFTVGLGKGPASVRSPGAINDGQWHTAVFELSRKSISVSVDGGVASDGVPVKGNTLDVSSTLYLGGVPHTHPTKRTGNVSNSLSSCIRSVSMGGKELDLSSPASQHHTTSCFTNQQTGSYFNGSGHAMLVRDGYKVGSDMTVSLEFRTSQSEAVLLGISSAKVDAIGLEIVNGQVYFHVNNGAGRVSVRSAGHGVCDDLWHRLVATKTKHRLSLSLDGVTTHTLNPHPQSTSAETNNPVYLGGYPGGVRQNCLSSTSWFKGCMKDVRLVKGHVTQELDLSSASSLSGVTAGACPA